MKGVIFDIEGKFAHFRKIFTNSSSLSYTVPPRTTIQGIIAAILGYERDTYYSRLHSSKVQIGVRKNCATYSMTHTLNYIRAVSPGELVKPKEHTQIPFEILASENKVSYRVYVASNDFDDLEIFINRLREERYVFPPSMGTAFFSADISLIAVADFMQYSPDEVVPIATVINSDVVEKLDMRMLQGNWHNISLIKEKMPRDFNNYREILPAPSYFVETNGNPIYVKLKEGEVCWKVSYNQTDENVVFM